VPNPSSREELLFLEEPIIYNLGEKAPIPYNPPITDLSMIIVVQVLPYECSVVSPTTMEAHAAISSGNTDISFMTVTTGGVTPPKKPSSVQSTMVPTASTLGIGPIPSMVAITALFPQNMTGSPFSYRMPGFGMIIVLSSSSIQTLGLGVGSSNAPLQGSIGGTSTLFITFPYDGGHIPPSCSSLSGVPQHSVGPNINLFGEGSQALPPYNMLVGLKPFSLFDAFGNNTFSLASISAGGNPSYGQPHPVHGIIPA
jgi:hypothetical protein